MHSLKYINGALFSGAAKIIYQPQTRGYAAGFRPGKSGNGSA